MKNYRLLSGAVAAALVASMATVPALAANFKDTDNHWAKDAINRWSDYGVVKGSNGEFRPDSAMTRAEFAQVLANLLHLPDAPSSVSFNDVADTDWFASAIKNCAAAGIIKGDGTNANPTAAITREEAMVMLGRALGVAEKTGSLDYSDGNQVASWAKGFVKAMTDKGYVHGVGENTLAPKSNINRASLMTIIDNAVKAYVNTANSSVTAASEGITLVVEPDVTVSGAANDLVVAGGAKGGTTTVAGGAKVADTVAVTAQNATVVLAAQSTTENAVLTENATGSKIVVEKKATANSIAVKAARSTVSVSGNVGNVTVEDSAANATVTANSGAVIDKVTVDADNVKIDGAGKVSNAEVNGNNTTVNTVGTKVDVASDATGTTSNGKNIASGSTTTTTGNTSGGGGGGSSSTPSVDNAADLATNLKNYAEVKLSKDFSITAKELADAVAQRSDATIDLNSHTLNVTADANGKTAYISHNLTIKNGNITGNGVTYTTSLFQVGGVLTLNAVKVTTTGSAIQVNDGATLNVTDSELKTTGDGVYCIATNASDPKAAVGGITVTKSTLTTAAADSCAFMLNIGGKATLDGCTINGQRQGVVVRAGSVDIKNCKIDKTSEKWDATKKWASGNEVADGSVVVGANGVYGPVGTVSIDSATTVDGRIIKAKSANLVNNTNKTVLEWSIS